MATGRVNVGSGGGAGMNVYAQLTEPTKKEGIWIKTRTAKKSIINDLELWFKDKWNDLALKKYSDAPYGFNGACAVSVGKDIYTMGGSVGGSNYQKLYKYDTIADTWTRLADIPVMTNSASAVFVGGNIYLIQYNNGVIHKYNILTNAWTALPVFSINSGDSLSAVVVGTDIWCFWTYGTGYSPVISKYNTLTDKWITGITNVGNQYGVRAVAVGTDIYLIGMGANFNSGAVQYLKKYNTLTGVLSPLADAPFTGGPPAVAVGTNLHVAYLNKHYVYNIVNNTWTLLSGPIPTSNTNTPATMNYLNGYIVVFDVTAPSKNVRYNFTSKVYEDGTVILYRLKNYPGAYQTELMSLPQGLFTGINNRILSTFDNVYMYTNGNLNENLPTYYGDGTQWVQFKGY